MYLAAITDEVAPDVDDQLAILAELGINQLELRQIGPRNLLDLTGDEVSALGRRLAAAGFRVCCVASPVGKIPLAEPVETSLRMLATALEAAAELKAPLVRVFSYYVTSEEMATAREPVLERLRWLTEEAGRAGITLVLENHGGTYTDSVERTRDILQTLNSSRLRLA